MVSSSKISYSQRLFLWLLCYSLVLVGCFIGFQYHREKIFKAEELNAQLQLINEHILDDIALGADVAKVSVSQPHLFDELRVSVIDNRGQVIYDNSLDSIPQSNHLSRKEISDALKNGSAYTVRRHSESTGNVYFYSATVGKDGYIVRTAVPYSVTLRTLLKTDYGYLWIMGIIATVICIMGYFATRRIGLHILRLNRFAEAAERGERIYETTPFPKDELGSISHHIIQLYSNLQQAIADRDKEHRAAICEQIEKHRLKRQLTNNINHELKTPVASIQLCLETLLTHDNLSPSKRDEFLRRCLANTERLKHLLEDVSLITRLDDAPTSISKEAMDLKDLITDVVDDCRPVAGSRGITIINDLNKELLITGNRSLLESVFRNLIDNAIAYSGGDKITIRLVNPDNADIVIELCDNGCGVKPEHLPHLFERFYRVDSGRSRLVGGTGLGLAIVKNSLLLHKGTISVENRQGGGLRFTITIKA